MSSVTQIVRISDPIKTECCEKAVIDVLYNELSKGIESLKKGDVYTVDEAWEEINKI